MSTATVERLQVSVKVLTINKKQVTLSMFRQFPVFLDTGYLFETNISKRAVIWGFVRYTWKGDRAKEGHFVVCHNGTLFRAVDREIWYCMDDEIEMQEKGFPGYTKVQKRVVSEVLEAYEQAEQLYIGV